MNRNYDGCKRVFIISKPVNGKRKRKRVFIISKPVNGKRKRKRVFIISKPVNGKRKQTLKQNLYLLCLHIHVHKIIELQMSHLTRKDLTNTLIKL